jgi:hypothetical protein
MQYAKPSDPITGAGNGFTDIAGDFICNSCNTPGTALFNGTNINNTAYGVNGFNNKVWQVVWAGARYSVTDSVDVAVAAYHYDQAQFSGTAKNSNGSIATQCAANPTIDSSCAGSMNAASVLVDWKFAPKWDTYIGAFYSEMNGGLANGFLARNNLATTAGIRFRF